MRYTESGFCASAVNQSCPAVWALTCEDAAIARNPFLSSRPVRARPEVFLRSARMTRVELVRLSHLPSGQETRMELCVVTRREIIRSSVVIVVILILIVAVLVMAGLPTAAAIATVTAAGTAGLALTGRPIDARD